MIERMGAHKRIVAAVFAAAVAGSAATALAKEVNEHRPVDADGEVSIKNINGSISVTGWSKNEVEVTGTITGDVEEVLVEGTAKRVRVEARFPENSRHTTGSADLVIKAPVGAGIRVDVVNATVTVGGVGGEVEVEAVNGDITVTDRPARLTVQTVNGVITVRGKCAQVESQTVGGRIILEGVEGDITASAVGGEIRVTGNAFGRVKMSSVSGAIDFTGGLAKSATVRAESHSGDVTLHLPAGVSAEFEASTFSGDVRNAFGSNGSKSQYGPGRTLAFTAGDGDARVSITTFSGDVDLVKK